jgi:hypothetical protein
MRPAEEIPSRKAVLPPRPDRAGSSKDTSVSESGGQEDTRTSVTSVRSSLTCGSGSGIASRPFLSRQDGRKPRSKRCLTAQDIADIVRRYGAGETTQQIGNRYGISKTRVAKVLCEQGVAIRRQGLNDEQANEAAKLYAAGRSLAWLGVRYDVSHATIAAALRRRGVHLRPRPGWTIPVRPRGE